MDLPKNKVYSIGEAAKAIGVSVPTLRRWDKIGKIKIGRKTNGYRCFTEAEIKELKQTQIPHEAASVKIDKPYSTPIKPVKQYPMTLILSLFAVILILIASNTFVLSKTDYPRQAVLGAETFIAPALEESAPLGSFIQSAGKTISTLGNFLKNNPVSSFIVTVVQKVESSSSQSTSGNLEVNGKAVVTKDIEGLENLKIKGTGVFGKVVTGVIDPYLIENDGSVQSTLEIKSAGDINLEPQGSVKVIGDLSSNNLSVNNNSNVTGNETVGGTLTANNLTLTGTFTAPKITTTGDASIGGNITLSGVINSNTLTSTSLVFAGSSPSIYAGTTNTGISLNSNGTGAISIGNSSKGDIYIGGGTTSTTYCLFTNSSANITCSGDITAGGNLYANGGYLKTSSTTGYLFNTTATTLNIGGAATTLSIGASSGTTTINNAETVTGALTGSSTLSITGATTLSSTLTVTGTGTLNGNVTLGSSSSQTLAVNAKVTTSIIPNATGNVDLGSSSLKWNNLYTNTINTSSTNTSGQAVFTQNPASTAITDASVLINPTTVTNNGSALLGIAVGGTEKARIDETGKLTLQGGLTIAANQNLTLSSGTGTQTQTYSNSSGTASTLNVTNSASSGTTTVNGLGIALTGTANATGSNTLNALNLSNVTAQTNNTFNGLNFGTGFNNFITSGTFNLTAAGALSGATTISASGNINSTSGALQTNSITRIDNSGNLTAGTGSFAGAVTASVDNTYALGSSSVRWSAIYVSGDVNAGDVVFNNDFRLRERGKTGIDLLTPDGVVVASFDRLGNIWIRGEIKKLKD